MTTINVRVDEKLKMDASELFDELGLNISTAINIFLRQSLIRGGLPFEVVKEVPNETTLAAMKEAEEMMKNPSAYKGYTDIDAMFEDILK